MGDDGAELVVLHGVDAVAAATDSDRSEVARRLGFDDAVNVFPLLFERLTSDTTGISPFFETVHNLSTISFALCL